MIPSRLLNGSLKSPYVAIPKDRMESFLFFLTSLNTRFIHVPNLLRIFADRNRTILVHCYRFMVPLLMLSVWGTSFVSLSSTEPASIFGFGVWLLTSASEDFIFYGTHATSSSKTESLADYRICIITLNYHT